MLTVDRLYTIVIQNLTHEDDWVLFQKQVYGNALGIRYLKVRIDCDINSSDVFLAKRKNCTDCWNYHFRIRKYKLGLPRNELRHFI